MSVGAFLKRELITSSRRGATFSGRRGSVILPAVIVAGCLAIWDWQGWDRASVAGGASFARVAFGLIIASQAFLAMVVVPALVAPLIASERDLKSLDSLLASRLKAAEVVLGTLGAGLLRYANCLVALAPIFTLMVAFGGIDPRLVLLSIAGLASTVVASAAVATVVSIGATTAARATSSAVGLAMGWLGLPTLVVLLLPRVWPAGASWVVPIALPLIDSSPIGVGLGLGGLIPRGPLALVVTRMIAYQLAASLVLVAWAIARLRPASRAVYDVEQRAESRRRLANFWRPRPPCGDDPILWREFHPARSSNPFVAPTEWLLALAWLGGLSYATWLFAAPAFAEVLRHGYGPSPGKPTLPEVSPFVRVLVGRSMGLSVAADPGLARLEFNIVLRQSTATFAYLLALMVAGSAAECLAAERERDTWLGLIATPLTGREILRAKMIGAIWKSRWLAIPMLALWAIGLVVGALHPLGFLAAVVGVGVTCWFLAALGAYLALWSPDRGQATGKAIGPLLLALCLGFLPFLLPGTLGVLMASGSMPFQLWASMLSYDDAHAAANAGAFLQYASIGMQTGPGPRVVLAAWLVGTTAQALAAYWLARSAFRGFDAAVGRPIRSVVNDPSPVDLGAGARTSTSALPVTEAIGHHL